MEDDMRMNIEPNAEASEKNDVLITAERNEGK